MTQYTSRQVGGRRVRMQTTPSTSPVEPPSRPRKNYDPSCWVILWEIIKEKYPKERTPLVISLLLLMALPSVVLLVTGTSMRSACVENQDLCHEECRLGWQQRKSELVGEAKYVVRNEVEKTNECYASCDAVASRCSTEVMLLFLGVGCFAGASACGITMGLMIGVKDPDAPVEEMPQPRAKASARQKGKPRVNPGNSGGSEEGDSGSPTSPKLGRSGSRGASNGASDPENPEEELTEEERMYERERKKQLRNTSKVVCPDCESEFRTRLPWGNQRHMHVSPVVCPYCGYVVAGVL